MAKPEWGVKRQCLKCGAAFYDLNKSPTICPKCGASATAEDFAKPRRATKVDEKAAVKKAAAKKGVAEEADEPLLDAEGGDDELLDDADMDDDADDIGDAIQGGEKEGDT